MDTEVEVQEKNSSSHKKEEFETYDAGESNLSESVEIVQLETADKYEKKDDITYNSLDNQDTSDVQSVDLKLKNQAIGVSSDKSDTTGTQPADSEIVENNTDLWHTQQTENGINGKVTEMTDTQPSGTKIIKNNPASSDTQSTELKQSSEIQTDVTTTIKIEPEDGSGVIQNSDNLTKSQGNVDTKLNGNQFNVIRDSDGDMTSDSDSDSSSSSDSEDAIEPRQNNAVMEMEDDDSDKGKKLNKNGFEDIRTKGEILPEELPPIEQLNITISDDIELKEIGTISSIVGVLVIIQSNKDIPPLNEQTFVFHDRKAVGQIFEVFGPVAIPWYSIRFNSVEDVHKLNLQVGNTVYYAPKATDFTNYVFVQDLQSMKGSDASWENNNEPPAKHIDYSDDEDEKRAKAKKRNNNLEAVIKKEVEEGSLLPGANPYHKQRNSSRPYKRPKGKMADVNNQRNHNNKSQTSHSNNNNFNGSTMQDYSQAGNNNRGTRFHGNCAPGFLPGCNNQTFTQRPMRNDNPFQNTQFTLRNGPQYFHTDGPRMQNIRQVCQPRWPQATGAPPRWSQPPLHGGWQQSVSPLNQNSDFIEGHNWRSVNYNHGQHNNRNGTENVYNTCSNHLSVRQGGQPAGHSFQRGENNRLDSTNMHQIPGPGNQRMFKNGANSDFQAYWSSMNTPTQGVCYQQNFNSSQPPLNNGHQPVWSNVPSPFYDAQISNSNQNTIVDRRLVFNQQMNPSK